MATRLALPATLYSDVLKSLRQRKAAGQTVTPQQERAAWQSYWDAMAARQSDVRRLGIAEETLALNKKRVGIEEQQAKDERQAAKVKGLVSIGQTAALGAYALKGTALGAKLGLGAATGSALTAGTVAPAPAGEMIVGGEATAGATGAPSIAGAGAETGSTTTAGSLLLPAGVGFAAGKIGAMIPIGSGEVAERTKGSIFGAAAGFAVGGPVGGVIGAIAGIFGGGGCIIITAATSPDSYEVNVARIYRDYYMGEEVLRGYYRVAAIVVPWMKIPVIKKAIKKNLVDHLIKYAEFVLGAREMLQEKTIKRTHRFLRLCRLFGGGR